MKKAYIITALCLMAGCTRNWTEISPELRDTPDVFYAVSEEEDRTKTSLSGYSVIWSSKDAVSIFGGTTDNNAYKVRKGTEGSTSAVLAADGEPKHEGPSLPCNVAFYPYTEDASIVRKGDIYTVSYTIPSTQTFSGNSFGQGAMPMMAVTSDVEDHTLSFNNVSGLLKLQFKGDGYPVHSITITGNNDEKISGPVKIERSHSSMPTVSFQSGATGSVVLECGGVKLDGVNVTEFFITLPPVTFSNGITVTVESENGQVVKTRTSALTITRSDIQPMVATTLSGYFSLEGLTLGETTFDPLGLCAGHYSVCLPPNSDLSSLVANFSTDATSVTVESVTQQSGVTINDFTEDVIYNLSFPDGNKQVKVSAYNFDLPAVYLETPDQQAITSKDDWMKNASVKIWNTDGKVDDIGGTSVKGRGNSTWKFPKKPYTLKLDSKAKVLGMPKDKRWNLLANWVDRTLIRNAVVFEMARKTDLEWTPNCRYVELILNGEHQGNYLLTEHIKGAEKRVPIEGMTSEDITEPNITGGYLVEYDVWYDEVNRFRTCIRSLPANIKEPDEDVLVNAQFKWIQNCLNSFELAVYGFGGDDFKKYIDIESFIDYWFIYELCYEYDAQSPRSVYMYKKRSGDLYAGPVWDFDLYTFRPGDVGKWCLNSISIQFNYYYYMLQDPYFAGKVKERWAMFKPGFEEVYSIFIDQVREEIRKSEMVNHELWPVKSGSGLDPTSESHAGINGDRNLTYDESVDRIKSVYRQRIDWLANKIKDFPDPIDPIDAGSGTTTNVGEHESDW